MDGGQTDRRKDLVVDEFDLAALNDHDGRWREFLSALANTHGKSSCQSSAPSSASRSKTRSWARCGSASLRSTLLMQITGVGLKAATLLRHSGVESTVGLATSDPEELLERVLVALQNKDAQGDSHGSA